jgi:hypothetical protein
MIMVADEHICSLPTMIMKIECDQIRTGAAVADV